MLVHLSFEISFILKRINRKACYTKDRSTCIINIKTNNFEMSAIHQTYLQCHTFIIFTIYQNTLVFLIHLIKKKLVDQYQLNTKSSHCNKGQQEIQPHHG